MNMKIFYSEDKGIPNPEFRYIDETWLQLRDMVQQITINCLLIEDRD